MTPECVCEEPGYCHRFNRLMTNRLWQLCANQCPPELPCTSESRIAALAVLNGERPNAPVKPRPYLSGSDRLRTCVHRGRSVKDAKGQTVKRLCAVG